MDSLLAPFRLLCGRESQFPAKELSDSLQIGHELNAVFTFERERRSMGWDFLTESEKTTVLLRLQFEDLPGPFRIFDGISQVRRTQ